MMLERKIDRLIIYFKSYAVSAMHIIFVQVLRCIGYKSIKYKNKKQWHDGFFYLTATHQTYGKVFIKCEAFGKNVLNELFFYEKIVSALKNINTPHVHEAKSFIFFSYASIEYLDDAKPISKMESKQILKIVDDIKCINEGNIIIRDLKPDNILVSKDKIYLIDYTFCLYKGELGHAGYHELKNRYLLEVLGNKVDGRYGKIWDDMYSMNIIAENFGLDENSKKEISGRIGERSSIS
ncbi:TPA: hypothetical protein NJ263_002852 [Vibrio parahaemolyticus]|nr:hypothetical protein [Vibrio parahaemolyticus]